MSSNPVKVMSSGYPEANLERFVVILVVQSPLNYSHYLGEGV